MSDTISQALVEATDQLESEVSLAPAIAAIPQMADLQIGRITLQSCIEKILLADGSVVEVLEAEQAYKDWRADHLDLVPGNAQCGEALVKEMRATMEMLNSPSMESDTIQAFKRTFGTVALALKTFGKNLNDLRNGVNQHKTQINQDPVLLTTPSVYGFLTRDNKAVKLAPGSIDVDIAFINECEQVYNQIFDKTTELAARFREATKSDSSDNIRDAISYFESVTPERTEFHNLTKFKLLGNRTVSVDGKGFPHFYKASSPWNLKEQGGLMGLLVKKKIHGFAVGGEPITLPVVSGINNVAVKRQVRTALQASGGVVSTDSFVKLLDKAMFLNSKAMKFASMGKTMSERLERLEGDMFDAYDDVNEEKMMNENVIRLRELRALKASALKSVAMYMFMAKSLAVMMEDHTSFVYRNVAIMANEVLKKSK